MWKIAPKMVCFKGVSALFILCLLQSSVTADQPSPLIGQEPSVVAEGAPSSFVNKNVNVIFGSFHHSAHDLIVPGPTPLHLKRHYSSKRISHNWMGYASMSTSHPTKLQGHKPTHQKYWEMATEVPGGSHVKHIAKFDSNRLDFYLHPEVISNGFTNNASDEISGHTNLKNTRYVFHAEKSRGLKPRVWTAELGDGTLQTYHKVSQFTDSANVRRERKPNGNHVHYTYHHNGHLQRIETRNAQNTQVLNWLSFDLNQKHKKATVTSSNGRVAQYSFFKKEEKTIFYNDIYYIYKVVASDAPTVYYEYAKVHNRRRIRLIKWPRNHFLEIEYDKYGRVTAEKAPAGKNGEKVALYRFEYKPSEYHTNVWDAYGYKTVYRYSTKNRLTCVDRFVTDGKGPAKKFYRGERLYWGKNGGVARGSKDRSDEGHLLARVRMRGDGKVVSSTALRYDTHGNVIQEDLYGNITGKKKKHDGFTIWPDGVPKEPGIELHRKRYTYSHDQYNVKLSETTDTGAIIRYGYKQNSNLCTSKLTYDGTKILMREFFEYDDSGTLTKSTIDDGSSQDPQNMKSVTIRKITRITPTKATESHGVGKPGTTQEYYLDLKTGKEVLLKQSKYTYHTAGHTKSEEVRDANGALKGALSFLHDSRGLLTYKKDAVQRTYTYSYDEAFNKTREELIGSGTFTTYHYDQMNRCTQAVEHHGNQLLTTSYEYDPMGNKISSTDHFGQTTNYEYDELHRLVRTFYPESKDQDGKSYRPLAQKEYDVFDNVISETDENNHKTAYDYNVRSQIIQITYPDGSREKFEYNSNGTLAHSLDKNGIKTSYSYDALGRVLQTTLFDRNNKILSTTSNSYNAFHLLSTTDAMGHTTFFSYDGVGRLIEKTKKDTNNLSKTLCEKGVNNFSKTNFEYDSLGRVATEKKWTGSGHKEYILTKYLYDALDRVISEQKEDGSGTVLAKTTASYDIFGHETKTVTSIDKKKSSQRAVIYNSHRLPVTLIDELGNKTELTYDYNFLNQSNQKVLKKTITDPLGQVTHETTDTLGRLTYIELRNNKGDFLAGKTIFYDAAGNRVKQVERVLINGITDHEYTIIWQYDAMDRVQKLIEQPGAPEEKITSYSYYPTGMLKSVIKPDGVILTHTYDALNRLITKKSSDGSVSYSYKYDRNGNPIAIRDHIFETVHKRAYDAWSRLIGESHSSKTRVSLEYDALGRITAFTPPDGSQVQYHYKKGELSDVTRLSPHQKWLYRHSYKKIDLQGRVLESELIGACGTMTMAWDKKGRPVTISSMYFTQNIPSDGFDAAGNLQKLTLTDEMGSNTSSFSYDDRNRMIQEQGVFTHTYSYDSLGNRILKDGQLHVHDKANKLLVSPQASFSYDKNGNLIQKVQNGITTNYQYDALDRLVAASSTNGFMARYIHDSFDRRIRKETSSFDPNTESWSNTAVSHFIYQGDYEVGALDINHQLVEFRTLGKGQGDAMSTPVALELNGATFCPLYDHRGSICALVDPVDNTVSESKRYSAFGEETILRGNNSSPWGFKGNRFDKETGHYYSEQRYYVPDIGRWITPNPAGLEEGSNLYMYANNNPLQTIE